MSLSTEALAAEARRTLACLAYPDRRWVEPRRAADGRPVHAVIIVGGGQSGLIAAADLKRQGVDDVVVLDRATAGREGVWDDFARMEELRTPKAINGSDFGNYHLSIEAWYRARHGDDAWTAIERIPRRDWAAYLAWYRDTLRIDVTSGAEVLDIRPHDDAGQDIEVLIRRGGQTGTRLARTVVLATGYDGAGGWQVPRFVSDVLPRDRYDHSNGAVDFGRLAGARVAVLGHGASAFDNALAALRAGAHRVDLCFRRTRLPRVNPHRHLEDAGTMTHFPELDDATRWRIARHFRRVDQPPPRRAFEAALAHPGFHLHPARPWLSVAMRGREIEVATPRGSLRCDHLLLATGSVVDLALRTELTSLVPCVALWSERHAPPPEEHDPRLGAFPYLARDFAFEPKHSSGAWVRRVFCFNGAGAVSHGPHSTSISGHRHALPRLVRGVTRRLFADQAAGFMTALEAYADVDLALAEDFEAAFAGESVQAACGPAVVP